MEVVSGVKATARLKNAPINQDGGDVLKVCPIINDLTFRFVFRIVSKQHLMLNDILNPQVVISD